MGLTKIICAIKIHYEKKKMSDLLKFRVVYDVISSKEKQRAHIFLNVIIYILATYIVIRKHLH